METTSIGTLIITSTLQSMGPKDGHEFRIICCGMAPQKQRFEYDSSENDNAMIDVAKQMTNLEVLHIFYMNYNEDNFDFCLPFLIGLKSCRGPRELKMEYQTIPRDAADMRTPPNPNFR